VKSSDFQDAIELIDKSDNVLITTHTRPDGDACGCVVAFEELLGSMGKKVQTLFLSEIPQWYGFLFEQKPAMLDQDVSVEQLSEAGFDLIILVDVNSNGQLPGLEDFLKQNSKKILIVDHHETSDGLGDVELVDSTAAATGLIVLDLFRDVGWEITEKIATALFVAVATDTGWFRFRNTDQRVFRSCVQLIDAGADPPKLFRQLYMNITPERFKLMTAAANSAQLHFNGRLATQQLTRADFEQTGASYADTENVIDQCRRIAGVEVAVLLVELSDGRVKLSLRSTGAVDVSEIAAMFGGGGHKMAAGATLDGPVEKARQIICERIGKALGAV